MPLATCATSMRFRQEDGHLHPPQEVTFFYYQEEERFFPCVATAHPIRDSHNLANENPLYSDLPVSVNRLCVHNSPSQLPFSSIKEFTLFGFATTSYGLP